MGFNLIYWTRKCVFLIFGWFFLGKLLKSLEIRQFSRADTAGLGKYRTGGYGRIGVYKVNVS